MIIIIIYLLYKYCEELIPVTSQLPVFMVAVELLFLSDVTSVLRIGVSNCSSDVTATGFICYDRTIRHGYVPRL